MTSPAQTRREYIITETQLRDNADGICLDDIMKIRSRPASAPTPDQCESCMFTGIRECMYHGYPDEVIPKSCSYKIGKSAVIAPIEAQMHNKQHDVIIRKDEREKCLETDNILAVLRTRFSHELSIRDYIEMIECELMSLRTTEAQK